MVFVCNFCRCCSWFDFQVASAEDAQEYSHAFWCMLPVSRKTIQLPSSTIDIKIMFYTCAAGQNIWMPFCGPLSSTLMPFVNIAWQRQTKTLLSQGNPEPRVISSNMLSSKPRVHNSLTPLLNIFLQGCLVRMQGKCWRGGSKAYLRPEWTLEKPTPSSSWGWGTETVTTLNKEGK